MPSNNTVADYKITEIIERVVSGFTDADGDEKRIVSQWESKVLEVQDAPLRGVIEHEFSAPQVIDALVEYFRADIEEDVALQRARVSARRRRQAHSRLLADIAEFDGFDFDEDRDHCLLEARCKIVRETEAHMIERGRKIVEISRGLAEKAESQDDLGPADRALVSELSDYFQDLTSMRRTNPEETRELVQRIVSNPAFAKSIQDADGAPNPMRFLARFVTAIDSYDCKFEAARKACATGTYV